MTKITDAIAEYEFSNTLLSPHTRRWYSSKLRYFNEYCEEEKLELEGLTIKHIRLFIEWLKKRTNPHTDKPISTYTIHGYTAVVKRFLAFLSTEEDFNKIIPPTLPGKIKLPIVDRKLTECYTDAQVQAMIDAISNVYRKTDTLNRRTKSDTLEVRDRAIVMVLADTGIRLGELCRLEVGHCYLFTDDAFLKIHGTKGHMWREVPLGRRSLTALRRYITRWRKPFDPKEQHVFIARSGRPIDPSTIDGMIKKLGQQAGITNVRVSAHTFRAYFAVSFLKSNKGDVARLSRQLGHASIGITERYVANFKSRDARVGSVSVLDTISERNK